MPLAHAKQGRGARLDAAGAARGVDDERAFELRDAVDERRRGAAAFALELAEMDGEVAVERSGPRASTTARCISGSRAPARCPGSRISAAGPSPRGRRLPPERRFAWRTGGGTRPPAAECLAALAQGGSSTLTTLRRRRDLRGTRPRESSPAGRDWVAAIMRTSTFSVREPPRRSKRLLWSHAQQLHLRGLRRSRSRRGRAYRRQPARNGRAARDRRL